MGRRDADLRRADRERVMAEQHTPGEPRPLASDPVRLSELFGRDDLLPLWIAEPYLELAKPVRAAIEARANAGWYGYEARPSSVQEAFWDWMADRHGWSGAGLSTMVSPSVGTSIGVLIDQLTTWNLAWPF